MPNPVNMYDSPMVNFLMRTTTETKIFIFTAVLLGAMILGLVIYSYIHLEVDRTHISVEAPHV